MAHQFLAASLPRGQCVTSPTNSLQGTLENCQLSLHESGFSNGESASSSVLWEERFEYQAHKRRMLDNNLSQVQSSPQQHHLAPSASPSLLITSMQRKPVAPHTVPSSFGITGTAYDYPPYYHSNSMYLSFPYCEDNPLDEPSPLGLTLRKTPSLLDFFSLNLSQKPSSQPPASSDGSDDAVPEKRNEEKKFGSQNSAAKATDTSSGFVEAELSPSLETVKPSSEVARDRARTSSLPISSLHVGTWKRSSNKELEIVAKFLYGKQKLVWEICAKDERTKMEIPWTKILFLSASSCPKSGVDMMEIKISEPPSFYMKKFNSLEKGMFWQKWSDFTDQKQATYCLHHFIRFSTSGILVRFVQKALTLSERLSKIACILNPIPPHCPPSLPLIPCDSRIDQGSNLMNREEGKFRLVLEQDANEKRNKSSDMNKDCQILEPDVPENESRLPASTPLPLSGTLSGSINPYLGEGESGLENDGMILDSKVENFIYEEKRQLFQHLGMMFHHPISAHYEFPPSSSLNSSKELLEVQSSLQGNDFSSPQDLLSLSSQKTMNASHVGQPIDHGSITPLPTDSSSDALDISILFDLDSTFPLSLPSFPDLRVIDSVQSMEDLKTNSGIKYVKIQDHGEVDTTESDVAAAAITLCSSSQVPDSEMLFEYSGDTAVDMCREQHNKSQVACTQLHSSEVSRLPKIASASELLVYLPKIASLPKLF